VAPCALPCGGNLAGIGLAGEGGQSFGDANFVVAPGIRLGEQKESAAKTQVAAENFTPEEQKRLKAASNGGYHYLGAAKTWLIIPSFAVFGATIPVLRLTALFWCLLGVLVFWGGRLLHHIR